MELRNSGQGRAQPLLRRQRGVRVASRRVRGRRAGALGDGPQGEAAGEPRQRSRGAADGRSPSARAHFRGIRRMGLVLVGAGVQ